LNEKYLSLKSKIGELENRESKNSKLIKLNHEDISKLEKDIQETSLKVREVENIIQALNQKKESLENQIKSQEKEFQEINSKIKAITQTLSQKRKSLEEVRENRNRLEINLSSIKKDLFQLEEISFKELNSELNQIEETEALTDSSLENLEKEYESANEKMIKMRDSDRLNFSAESEYEILEKDFNFLLTQKSDIENSIKDMNDAIKKIDEESQVSFLKAYNEIKINYQKNFKILFDGGEAELWLTDENNITETGLEIKAQPPGKKLQSLRLLSGGEKTLTSLAFLFALFEYKPSPFCVFDEVDAALDEANVRRFLKFVHKLKGKTQFLIITHNFKTMEEADYIYGITMNEPGISTIYSMKMTGKNQLVPEN
jgi:chromosome segregation protein